MAGEDAQITGGLEDEMEGLRRVEQQGARVRLSRALRVRGREAP
jgi:hypothetical protein